MQHQDVRGRRGASWRLVSTCGFAVVALACRADSTTADEAPAPLETASEVASAGEVTPPAGDDELDGAACPSALPPCGAPSGSPCRSYCQAAANGCVEVGEFHPLGELPPSYGLEWKGFDPAGEHALYSWHDTAGVDVIANFRWSASEGIIPLDPVLRASDPGTPSFFGVHMVSRDASAALIDDSELRSFYWSRAGGVQLLELANPVLSPAGGTVAGTSGRRALRWTAAAGREVVAELATSPVRSYAAGDVALYVEQRTITHVAGSGARTTLALPVEEPADALFGLLAANASGSTFAVEVADIPRVDRLTRPRLYRWSGQGLERITLPEEVTPGSNLHALRVSDDGRVIVAEAIPFEFDRWQLLRWSADEGARVLHEARSGSLSSVSPAGDVIVARIHQLTTERELVLRWSDEGSEELDGVSEDVHLALDGELFVDLTADAPVLKFGRARAAGTLPIERLPQGFVPAGWELRTLDAVSGTARVLAGTAFAADRTPWYWLSRLRAVCPEAP